MKKIISLLFIVSLIALLPVLSMAFDAPPVKLLLARGSNSDRTPHLFGYIEVDNMGENKQVCLVYQVNGGSWKELSATRHATTHHNLEAWYFQTPAFFPPAGQSVTIRFAAKYVVNGITYWDNNGGQDYTIKIGYKTALENILLGSATHYRDYGGWAILKNINGGIERLHFHGAVYVQNLAYDKEVKMVYTTDNWDTSHTADFSYSKTMANNIEQWGIMFEVPVDTTTIQYVISYKVNGMTHWDNNFQQNYTLILDDDKN